MGEKREEYVKGEYECEVLRKTFGEEEKRLNPLQLTNYTGLIDSQLYDKIPVDRGGKSINVLTGYYEFNDERENLENWLNGVDKHLQNIMQKFTYMVKRFKMIGIQIMKFDKILREDLKYFKMLNLQYSSKKLNYKNFSRFDMKRISQPLFSTSEASGRSRITSSC